MSEIVRAYEVNGYYVERGQHVAQSGEIFDCDDDKIVGFINDGESASGPVRPNVLFGLRGTVDDKLAFIKIPPAHHNRPPTIWIMRNELVYKGLGRGRPNCYDGYWQSFEDMPAAAELEALLAKQGLPEKEQLAEISKRGIETMYFTRERLHQVLCLGIDMNQRAELELKVTTPQTSITA